jgi:hypothetical protein
MAVFVLPFTPYLIGTLPQIMLTEWSHARLQFVIAPRVQIDWKSSPHQISTWFHRVGNHAVGSSSCHLGLLNGLFRSWMRNSFCAPSFAWLLLRLSAASSEKADRDASKLLSLHLSHPILYRRYPSTIRAICLDG